MTSQPSLPASDSSARLFRSATPALAFAALLLAAPLPLHGQVTVEVLSQADNFAPSPLRELRTAATRGGHFAHYGQTGIGGFAHHIVLWRDEAVAVRGARYDSALDLGHAAPGTGSTFSGLNDRVFVNASGQIAFTANTEDNSNFGFWAGAPGALQFVARHGSPAPGTNGNFLIGYPGNTFGELQSFTDSGQVALLAGIQYPVGTGLGLWAGMPGSLQLVAEQGSQAPGFPAGVTWDHLDGIVLNNAGQVGIYGRVTQDPPADTGLPSSSGYVLMTGPPGHLVPVVKAGDPAPGCEPFTFLGLSDEDYTLNASGQIAYVTGINTGKFGIVSSSTGLYIWSPGKGSELVLRSGYPGPGLNGDTVFGGFREPQFNAAGEIAVEAYTASGTESIWTGKPGRLRKVAMTNDVAPGTGGQLFGNFGDQQLLLSDSGQVAFRATYGPGGTLYPNNASQGLFATDKTGTLHFVGRIGAAIGSGPVLNNIELNTGNSSYGSGGRSDSGRSSYDRDGRLLFYATGHYNNPTTGNQHYQQFIYRATFPESAPLIPAIGQPQSVRGAIGGSAVFDVSALGSRPATYQWRRNGTPVANGTSAALSLTNLSINDRGAYTVVITNAQGSVTSAEAQLSFPPVLTSQPQDLQINADATAQLGVAASGPGTLAYAWQFKAATAADFSPLPSATGPTLTLANITAAQGGRYRVIVTNADGSTTSREAVVTVAAAGAPLVRRILIPGDVITGLSDRLTFGGAERATLNNAGEIALQARVANDSSGGKNGTYFRSVDGTYRFVTWQGFYPNLSDSGEFAQLNSRPITTIEQGSWHNMQPLARQNTTAPDGAGSYSNNGDYTLADDGTTAYRFGTHLGTGVFLGKPGATTALAFTSMAAPGLPAGVQFDSFIASPVINPSGTAAFWATLRGTGITADNDTSLWKGNATSRQRIVSEADLVPAAGAGVRVGDIGFTDFSQLDIGWNEAGHVAFATTLAGTGVTTANDKAILAGPPGALQVVAREGVANGHTFDFGSRNSAPFPIINRAGQVAFVAMVTPIGTSDYLESLWLWTPGPGGGTRQLIAREGQQAPGFPAGVVFDSDLLTRPYFACALNGSGQLAITASINGPGITYENNNDDVLYLTTPKGELKLVARSGNLIDLGGGEMRELGEFYGMALRSGGEDGRMRSLNEYGELIFPAPLRRNGSLALDDSIMMARLPAATGAFLPAYTAWASTAFPTGTPAALTAPDADADGDGLPNAIEYLAGTDPRTPSPSPETIRQLPDGSIRLTFPRRPGVPDGLEIIETTPELGGIWTPVPRRNITHTASGPGQPSTITVTLPAGADSAYVRLRVEF